MARKRSTDSFGGPSRKLEASGPRHGRKSQAHPSWPHPGHRAPPAQTRHSEPPRATFQRLRRDHQPREPRSPPAPVSARPPRHPLHRPVPHTQSSLQHSSRPAPTEARSRQRVKYLHALREAFRMLGACGRGAWSERVGGRRRACRLGPPSGFVSVEGRGARRCRGRSRGPRTRCGACAEAGPACLRTGGRLSAGGRGWVSSLRCPPVNDTRSGVPWASVSTWCFEPGTANRTRTDFWVAWPPLGLHMRGVNGDAWRSPDGPPPSTDPAAPAARATLRPAATRPVAASR